MYSFGNRNTKKSRKKYVSMFAALSISKAKKKFFAQYCWNFDSFFEIASALLSTNTSNNSITSDIDNCAL